MGFFFREPFRVSRLYSARSIGVAASDAMLRAFKIVKCFRLVWRRKVGWKKYIRGNLQVFSSQIPGNGLNFLRFHKVGNFAEKRFNYFSGALVTTSIKFTEIPSNENATYLW